MLLFNRGDRGTKTEIARTPYQYTFELDDAAAPIPPDKPSKSL